MIPFAALTALAVLVLLRLHHRLRRLRRIADFPRIHVAPGPPRNGPRRWYWDVSFPDGRIIDGIADTGDGAYAAAMAAARDAMKGPAHVADSA